MTTPADDAIKLAIEALERLAKRDNWKPFTPDPGCEADPWKPAEQYGLEALAALQAREGEAVAWHPTEAAITALKRFEETCADGEGYDVPKDTMRQLAMIGLVHHTSGGRYIITDFGQHILAAPQPAQPSDIGIPITQPEQVDWKDQYEKQKRRAEMWIAKYEKDIGPLEKVYPAAQPEQGERTDASFPFYELKFIMRVLGHAGGAPKQDWDTAYGMAREIFTRWHKESLQSAQPVATTVPDNSQDWKGMDGTTAFHLITRHADGWADVGKMMGEWLAANQAAQPVALPLTPTEFAEYFHPRVFTCTCGKTYSLPPDGKSVESGIGGGR